MRGWPIGLLTMVLAGAASAQDNLAGAAPASPEHQVVLPDWKRLPAASYFMEVYPKRARDLGVEGAAAMKCRVLRTGRLKHCEIISETPPGFGFGEAELRLAPIFLMTPELIDGQPVEAEVTVPIRFELKIFYVKSTPPAPSEHRLEDPNK